MRGFPLNFKNSTGSVSNKAAVFLAGFLFLVLIASGGVYISSSSKNDIARKARIEFSSGSASSGQDQNIQAWLYGRPAGAEKFQNSRINLGSAEKLEVRWESYLADSCSNNWNNSQSVVGQEVLGAPLPNRGLLEIVCSGPGGSAKASLEISPKP